MQKTPHAALPVAKIRRSTFGVRRWAFLAFLLLSGTPSLQADAFFPDTLGSTWEYAQTGASPSRFTVRLAARESTDGQDHLKLETKSGDGFVQEQVIASSDRGVRLHSRRTGNEESVSFEPPRTLLPVPLQVGGKWELDDDVAGFTMHQEFKVVAEETIVVPAGEFRAYRLHCEQPWPLSISIDRWFAPGVGFVKDVTTTRGPTGRLLSRVQAVLTKFSIEPTVATATPAPRPSGPPKITVQISKERDGPPAHTFRSADSNIYVHWHGEHLAMNSRVRVAWVVEDVGDVAEPNFIVDQTETEVTAPEFGARFTLARPSDGWAEGKYRLELYLDDVLTEKVAVSITE
ncbi:MAG: hypothetical protein ABIR71_13500 [Chthoniobacterales bacterium]